MARKPRPTVKKRQPAKKRLPLSSTKKSATKSVKAAIKKKAPIIKKTATKKSAVNKQQVKRKSPKNKHSTPLPSKARAAKPRKHRLTSLVFITKLGLRRHRSAVTVLLIVAGIAGTVFFSLRVLSSPATPAFKPTQTSHRVEMPPPTKQFLSRSQPTQLRIPDIELDTPLTTVGLHADGTLEVPADYKQAGWYRDSPTPGEIGPAVMVGHYDNTAGTTVFGRLQELTPGKLIEVERQDGTVAKFMIEQVKQFPQDDFPTAEVYGNIDYAGLRIITCGGTFNRLTRHYSHNTVTFAALVPPALTR